MSSTRARLFEAALKNRMFNPFCNLACQSPLMPSELHEYLLKAVWSPHDDENCSCMVNYLLNKGGHPNKHSPSLLLMALKLNKWRTIEALVDKGALFNRGERAEIVDALVSSSWPSKRKLLKKGSDLVYPFLRNVRIPAEVLRKLEDIDAHLLQKLIAEANAEDNTAEVSDEEEEAVPTSYSGNGPKKTQSYIGQRGPFNRSGG